MWLVSLATGDGGGRDNQLFWPWLVQAMAERYGFTRQQVGQMTLQDLRAYTADPKMLRTGDVELGGFGQQKELAEKLGDPYEVLRLLGRTI